MNALFIVLGIAFSYVLFVMVAVGLARVLFPKIEIDDEDLIGTDVVYFKDKVRAWKEKMEARTARKHLNKRLKNISTRYNMT